MYVYNGSLSKQNNSLEEKSATMELYSMVPLPTPIQESLLCPPVKDLLTKRWFQKLSGIYTWSQG